MQYKKFLEKFREYHFELRHLTVLFVILFSFQLIVSLVNKSSIKNFLSTTQEWYQKDSAEKLANLTAMALELQLESMSRNTVLQNKNVNDFIQSMNIIFSQQLLQHNLTSICVMVSQGDSVHAIDDGKIMYSYMYDSKFTHPQEDSKFEEPIRKYAEIRADLKKREEIYTYVTDKQSFNTFVPLIFRGEYVGSLYVQNKPDFSYITNQIITNYDETSAIYLSLILLGLLAMYFISTYTMKERDETQQLLFTENEKSIKKQINYEKEMVFTKRIYHTHHKAEKVMGFIKEDLRTMKPENIELVKARVSRYSNFVSRVIYDMKWFDPPVQTYRNQIFQTNLNEVIRFLVDNLFLRVADRAKMCEIILDFDEKFPIVNINEFVCWEILEPLIQNSIDHGGEPEIVIEIKTACFPEEKKSLVIIKDNGKGITPDLLTTNEKGIKRIFEENVTTKQQEFSNSGYGCYIAYEICKRCGWHLDIENLLGKGCRFIITIPTN